jgi:putative glycosyltransferase (TIGR04372 family)
LRFFYPKMKPEVSVIPGSIIPDVGRHQLWKPKGMTSLSMLIVEQQNWKWQYENYSPPKLRRSKHQHCEDIRIQMGIPEKDWFVCLHVSEGREQIPRHASIENYIEAVKLITDKGGWVVRLGDSSMVPLPKMNKVVDYALTSYKSEIMDLYLLSECNFFLGCNSGPPAVAFMFNKPYILANLAEWSLALPLKRNSLAITKHIFSRSRNRFLSIKEILSEPFSIQSFCDKVGDDFILVENTPQEIRDVVDDFFTQSSSGDYSDLQKSFNEGRREQIYKGIMLGEPFWPEVSPDGKLVEQYRVASRLDSPGTLGNKYLEQNWFVDKSSKPI